MCPSWSLGLSVLVLERWCLQDYGILQVRTVSYFLWTSCIGPWIISALTSPVRPCQNHLLLPWSFELMKCMLISHSRFLIIHVLGKWFFLHDRLGLIMRIRGLYLIFLWFCDLKWFLHHPPLHCFTWMLGEFLFLDSWHFLSNKYWTHTLILVTCGTKTHAFLGSERGSCVSKSYKILLLLVWL